MYMAIVDPVDDVEVPHLSDCIGNLDGLQDDTREESKLRHISGLACLCDSPDFTVLLGH